MMKFAVLMATLAVTLPVTFSANAFPENAVQEPSTCLGVSDLSAQLTARIYSVKPLQVDVSVFGARKDFGQRFLQTNTTTHISDISCTMTWLSEADSCWSSIGSLECKRSTGPVDALVSDRSKIQAAVNAVSDNEFNQRVREHSLRLEVDDPVAVKPKVEKPKK